MNATIEFDDKAVECRYYAYTPTPIATPGPAGLTTFEPGFHSECNARLVLASIVAVPREARLRAQGRVFAFEARAQQADQVWGIRSETE